jgi:glycosyltransferase involved in cell wall biosynthesis
MRPRSVTDGRAPAVSVVLPVFNGGEFLEEAVRSILTQTFHDFELIAIDDGSTDATLQILQGLKRQDARVFVVSRENLGLVATLNQGVQMARGTWIARMDADDIAEPTRLERQIKWLDQTGADICGSWVKLFGRSDGRILKHPQFDSAIKAELLFGSSFAHPTVVMRRELAKHFPYDADWDSCEDYELWCRAALFGWRMTNVPESLLRYRQHNNQVSSALAKKQHLKAQELRRRQWIAFWNANNIPCPEWIDEVLKLRESSPSAVNMDMVDSAFNALLSYAHPEARSLILHHMKKYYLRAAGSCQNTAYRWNKIHRKFAEKSNLTTGALLFFLSLVRASPDSTIFKQLQYAYIQVNSWR